MRHTAFCFARPVVLVLFVKPGAYPVEPQKVLTVSSPKSLDCDSVLTSFAFIDVIYERFEGVIKGVTLQLVSSENGSVRLKTGLVLALKDFENYRL